jgi:hypothetical protein
VTQHDFECILANSRGSSLQTNPIEPSDSEIQRILQERR